VGGKVGAVEVVSPRPLGGPRREGERKSVKEGWWHRATRGASGVTR
jgi:hypothetical protein